MKKRRVKTALERERDRENSRRWHAENRERSRENTRRWCSENRERHLENVRRWRMENPERHLENAQRWCSENRERHLANARRWHAENPENAKRRRKESPEYFRDIARRYRARKLRAAVGDIPRDAEHQLLAFQGGRCAYCHTDLADTGYEVDHVVPLARDGPYAWDNIVLACPRCNHSKNDKPVEEWLLRG